MTEVHPPIGQLNLPIEGRPLTCDLVHDKAPRALDFVAQISWECYPRFDRYGTQSSQCLLDEVPLLDRLDVLCVTRNIVLDFTYYKQLLFKPRAFEGLPYPD